MSDTSDKPVVPRAVIHKQILDTAADKPEDSIDAIAAAVPSATVDLVERVLEMYGDPADGQSVTAIDGDHQDPKREQDVPDPDDLSEKQLETLRVIYTHPEATQRDIADLLDVSGATISNRVNSIEEFDWEDRRSFAQEIFDTDGGPQVNGQDHMKSNETESKAIVEQMDKRITTVEQQVDELKASDQESAALENIELKHKIVHACLKSETISEDEELQILQELF